MHMRVLGLFQLQDTTTQLKVASAKWGFSYSYNRKGQSSHGWIQVFR